MSIKNSNNDVVEKALELGGVFYCNGTQVYIENPDDFDTVCSPTGFWIKTAMGFKAYIKAQSRRGAQDVVNAVFGKGRYTVNSKV